MDETVLLNRVLMNMNLSKLVDDDEPLFLALLSDVFGSKPNQQPDEAVKNALIANSIAHNLDPFPEWLTKAIQLQETCEVRHGIMILGPSGSGKSSLLNMLILAYSDTRGKHTFTRMNPKAITASQMFGTLDPSSNDWTDGIFSSLWRIANKTTTHNAWLGLDGPVDAIWIENLNSVLDDNKTLTLANGDRLPMASNVKLLFEMSSLDNASPATVSRAGMIYVPTRVLTWRPLAQSWVKREDFKPIEKYFGELIGSFDKLFTFVFKNLKMVMKTSQVHVITTLLNIFEALITTRDENDFIKLNCTNPTILKRLMIFSAMWAFGGFLNLDDRAKLSQWLCKEYSQSVPADLKDKSRLFDYVVDLESNGEWVHWDTRIEEYHYPKDSTPEFSSILVPTIDSTQIEYLLTLLAASGRSVLLLGESGTAKTATINTFLNKFDKEKWTAKTFNFSSATTPFLFQTSIESVIEKTIGTTFGPVGGKRMEVFIDDISMPEINEWGDQVTNEIVRQLMEDGGFYSLEKPGEFTKIIKTQFVAAMVTPGGGRNDVPDRLKRHFSVFNCTMPDTISIDRIYSTIIQGFFIPERGFNANVVEAAGKAVTATRAIWQLTKERMLPTPTKFHYVFNLRDLSRVTQGLLQVTSKEVKTPENLVSLWAHECFRVFPDKFTTDQDKQFFADAIVKIGTEVFSETYEHILKEASTRLWCSFMTDIDYSEYEGVDDSEIPRKYEQVPTFEALNKRCIEFMADHNSKPSTKKKLDLVLFDDAMAHLVRIARIIGMPRGHALLVGVGGSGKQSLTRLASTILNYTIFQITPGRNYSVNDFLTDIRELYRIAGVLNKKTTFIFTDNEVKQESFLEFINNILTTGEIANLFNRDTLEALMGEMRPIFIKECRGQIDTDQNVYQYFIDRVKKNLHIVLCFSPVGEQFRKRNLKFPGLFSGCTIDWFTHWPHQGLYSVADNFLKQINIEAQEGDNDIKDRLAETFALIHESVENGCEDYFSRFRRRTYVTPKSYLSFLSSFKSLYNTQLAKIQDDANRMKEGLQKIDEAKEQVRDMKSKLTEQQAQVAAASQQAQEVLDILKVQRAEAEAEAAVIQKQKDEQEIQSAKIAEINAKAQSMLEDALPVKEKALAALNTLTKDNMNELGSYKEVSPLINLILDCAQILLRRPILPYTPETYTKKNDSWDCLKSSVEFNTALRKQSSTLLSELQNFNTQTINDETIDLLRPYLGLPFFNKAEAEGSSKAAGGICDWVINICKFYEVEKFVRPIELQAQQATEELNKAQQKLNVVLEKLAEKQRALDKLQEKYDQAMHVLEESQNTAAKTQKQLTDATTLINALGGEQKRWEEQAKQLRESILRTVGNATIGAAFNSYCGMFNHTMRQHFLTEAWPNIIQSNQIPSQGQIDIINLFVNEATLDTWQLQGLPSDELSRQNGVICTNAPTYPLLIDPQQQAHSWIINKHKADNLIVTSFEDRYFKQRLEDALQLGRPLLVEDCGEEIDPLLDNVLAKSFNKVGRNLFVSIAGKDVEVLDGFTLYFTTKLANPKFSPETFAKCSVIEFSVTQNGLQEQLLNLVILREKESLEIQRQTLLANVAGLKARLLQLENDLLNLLRSSKGNLLENTSLITTLNNTKKTSFDTTEQLNEAMVTNQKINNSRKEYIPVALRGAVIYFLIQEMSQVNGMYQVSLNQFLGKFYQAIEEAEQDQMTSARINNIIQTLTLLCYQYIVRGLYEKDKLLFTLQLALKIQLSLGQFDFNDYQIFLKAGAAFSGGDKMQDFVLPDVFSSCRDNVLALTQISLFKGHSTAFTEDTIGWKRIMESQTPENEPLPKICENMQPFHRAVVIRCLRPDRAIFAANIFINESLGKEFLEYSMPGLDLISAEAKNLSPVIYLLSPGSDPTPLVEEAAKKAKMELHSISMGQGREEIAEATIQQAKHKGEWVLLQNCHLGLKYMNKLFEMYKEDIANAEAAKEEAKDKGDSSDSKDKKPEKAEKIKVVHPEYRLWITTEPHPNFPVSLLQLSLKLTNEPPAGARANLTRTFQGLSQPAIDVQDLPEWRRLIYVLAFFNTTVQERRKFGPLGWCIPYEFNNSDFSASLSFCSAQIADAQRISTNPNTNPNPFQQSFWQTVRYGICEIHYGGRVTDELDRRLINAIGEAYFCNERVFSRVNGAINSFDPVSKNSTGAQYPIFGDEETSVQMFLDKIKTLPQNDPPEVFGLNAIADVKLRRDQANEIFQKIIDVQPKESAVGGMTREDVVKKKCQELRPQVPDLFDMDKVRRLIDVGPDTQPRPTDVCAKQEIERMQNVLKVLSSTLDDLVLAIDGSIVMNDQLYNAMNSLFDGRIPQHWLRISWPADSLKAWMDEVNQRYQQYQAWIAPGSKLDTFWLGGMFNPGGFLTSVRQNTCRRLNLKLDETTLESEVQPPSGRAKSDDKQIDDATTVIYAKGIWLEGARWFKQIGPNQVATYGLSELSTTTGTRRSQKLVTDLRNEMPLIKMWAQKRDKNRKETVIPLSKDKVYQAPMYKNAQRTDINYITSLPLASADPKLYALHWVLRGVCLTTK
jgi:dynein heavy chain